MDSCARGAFLSGAALMLSLSWLQAARVSNSPVATKRIRVDRRRAYSASMCIGYPWFRSYGDGLRPAHRSERRALGEVIGGEMNDVTIGQKSPAEMTCEGDPFLHTSIGSPMFIG